MPLPKIQYCPGTLASGYETYSRTSLKRVFNNHKVSHILPYDSPSGNMGNNQIFTENQKRISISGVQEKFSILLEKNKLRLIQEGEQGSYILKPIPNGAKRSDQMPANEHLTMQIARQIYQIETAENALIFFKNGDPAYITKRFDINEQGIKLAEEDFATLAGKSPQTHGEHYKYEGNYLELFDLIKKFLPAYKLEIPKLYQLLVFNYLFSNGDAHFKNFSILETPMGDHRLSPAYNLLNTRMHVEDDVFALEGLLPKRDAQGTIYSQFETLAEKTALTEKQFHSVFENMLNHAKEIEALVHASFLDEKSKRNYLQGYKTRFKRLNPDM